MAPPASIEARLLHGTRRWRHAGSVVRIMPSSRRSPKPPPAIPAAASTTDNMLA
jgi:hypothetical protein